MRSVLLSRSDKYMKKADRMSLFCWWGQSCPILDDDDGFWKGNEQELLWRVNQIELFWWWLKVFSSFKKIPEVFEPTTSKHLTKALKISKTARTVHIKYIPRQRAEQQFTLNAHPYTELTRLQERRTCRERARQPQIAWFVLVMTAEPARSRCTICSSG